MRPAAFLDRDGVLNVDHGYVHKSEDWEWQPGAVAAIRWLKEHGYAVVVITNQSGIGRGFYSEEHVSMLHEWILEELGGHGAAIDRFYYCPHLAEENCDCRKPKPGMIWQAARELDLDLARSFIVGDRPSDIEAGEAAGIRGFLYPGGNLLDFLKQALGD